MSDLTLYREHTARRDYWCGRECGDPIKAGTRYTMASLPPGGELGNISWWNMRIHGRDWADCPSHKPEWTGAQR